MIESKNRLSLAFGVPGILIEIGCVVYLVASSPSDSFERVVVLFTVIGAAHVLILVGAGFYAESRGHAAMWCLMGLLGLPGLLALLFLPDRYKPRHPPTVPAHVVGVGPAEVSVRATTSMVLGIVAASLLVLCLPVSWIVAIPAIVIGRRAEHEIKVSGGAMLGQGRATTGIVTGYISLILGLLAIVGYVVLIVIVIFFDSSLPQQSPPPLPVPRNVQPAYQPPRPLPPSPPLPPSTSEEPIAYLPRDIQILTASYGPPSNGNIEVDVTELVKRLLDQGNFTVSNATMGGDPAFGLQKELLIVYEDAGERVIRAYIEGDVVAREPE